MLVRLPRNWTVPTLLAGMQTGTPCGRQVDVHLPPTQLFHIKAYASAMAAYVHPEVCTQVYIVALSVIAPSENHAHVLKVVAA